MCSGIAYGKRADIHEAFLSLGCALICWQSLQDVDHGPSWCPGASREQNPESLNTTALIGRYGERSLPRPTFRRTLSRKWAAIRPASDTRPLAM
jgi:hypothetical protein